MRMAMYSPTLNLLAAFEGVTFDIFVDEHIITPYERLEQ
jgi:hypothetical protein